MALKYGTSGGDFKGLPAGNYIAICDLVADLGLQPGSSMYPDPKHQIYLRFEVPSERIDYEKDGKRLTGPRVIGNAYTASMGKKANLRKQLEGWRGKMFTDPEAADFDVSTILGKACMLNVVEKESGGKTYSNIGNISALPKGMPVPTAENPLVLYTGESPEDVKLLPDWLQAKVKGQLKPEYINPTGCYAEAQQSGEYDFSQETPAVAGSDGTYITDEDIPF